MAEWSYQDGPGSQVSVTDVVPDNYSGGQDRQEYAEGKLQMQANQQQPRSTGHSSIPISHSVTTEERAAAK